MFFRYKNILLNNQLNKRFFSNNECNFNSNELDSIKNMLKHIYIMSTINYFITLVILYRN